MADDSSETRFLSMTGLLSLECALKVLHDSDAFAAQQQERNDARRERPKVEEARVDAPPPAGARRARRNATLMSTVKQALLYKTEWCNKEECPYKHRCQFCHPGETLRPRPSADVLRLKLDEAYRKQCGECAT